MNPSRRKFIKDALKTGNKLILAPIIIQGLAGCVYTDPTTQSPEEFTIENFDKWYRANKEYNKINPNLESPHRNMHTFKDVFYNGKDWTPGISYSVPFKEVMVASAPGKVGNIMTLHTGRAGGKMVQIVHPGGYWTYYAHLNKVFVKFEQKIKRGDPVGNVTDHNDYAKLMLHYDKDPDNYGLNHSYMNYHSNISEKIQKIDQEYEKLSFIDNCKKRFQKEYTKKVVESLISMIDNNKVEINLDRTHGNDSHRHPSLWTTVEHFKYLTTLYEIKPDLFSDLSNDHFQKLKRDFYDNQPIILTLPFKKVV